MDFRDAVKAAKRHVIELFDDERVSNVGLEEIARDDAHHLWKVTIGFSRPWDQPGIIPALEQKRTYKIVTIRDDDGSIISVSNRNGADD